MTSIQSFPFATQGKPFASGRQQTAQPYRAKLTSSQDSLHFASSHDQSMDATLTEEPIAEPINGTPLALDNPEERAILIEKYIGQFQNQDTQQKLTEHIQNHPNIAVEPSVYVNALRQLAKKHSDLSPERAMSEYSQFVHQQIKLDSPLARQLQDLPKARQRKQSLQNSNTATDAKAAENPFKPPVQPQP